MDNDELSFILNDGIQFLPGKRCIINQTGTVISLSENNYRFLLLLLNGETDKQNIINQVWHEQRGSVSDSSYYGQIYMLRKAFELVGLSSSLIKTIPRKGVKYMGKVGKIKADPDLEVEMCNAQTVDGENCLPQESLKINYELKPAGSGPQGARKSAPHNELFHSKRWNLLISILAVLAVCWLTTLFVAIIYLFF
ncbi:transcriptional regulator [Mixta theicola]|uniref:Transcriptional regulator n=2 Tax=Mixta theicola TaxID=1458355 RepID=A0A2K1QA82_9GAMM|nr:transcriptional regulator [Mixta theicola]